MRGVAWAWGLWGLSQRSGPRRAEVGRTDQCNAPACPVGTITRSKQRMMRGTAQRDWAACPRPIDLMLVRQKQLVKDAERAASK